MNWFDFCIALLLMVVAFRGITLGGIRQFFSATGAICGLLIGAWLVPIMGIARFGANERALLSFLTIGSCVLIGLLLFELIALQIVHRVRAPLFHAIDSMAGLFVGLIAALVLVWLVTPVLSRSPYPPLKSGSRESQIATSLRSVFPATPNIISRIGQLIDESRFPQVFSGQEPVIDTTKPLPDLGPLNTAVAKARESVVRIEGIGCGGIVEGSGFVAGENLIITNAHVVAGVSRPSLVDGGGRHSATLIYIDPDIDIAVLRAEGLRGRPLSVAPTSAENGTIGAALGYPGGGDFVAKSAEIIDRFIARGRNIYNKSFIDRTVYSLHTDIAPGNSGGPLIDKDSQVVGLIFAESTEYNETGYALVPSQIQEALAEVSSSTSPVESGKCAPH